MRFYKTLLGVMILSAMAVGLSAQKKLVIIGSSTSACMNVDPVTECYVGRLNSYYNKIAPLDTTIDNHLARGGSNCYNGMPSTYVSPYPAGSIYLPVTDINITAALALKPDVVLVNYPTNAYDVLSISEVMFCLRTIKNEANKNGIPCFVTTSQPRTSAPIYNNSAMKLKLAVIKDSILAAFGSYAVDFYTGLINPADSSILYDSGDQTHMNGTGHNILFQRVLAKNVFGLPPVPVPGCAVNTSPSNGTTITTQTSATLSWAAAANATSYDVYLQAGTGLPVILVTNTAALTYSATGLSAGTTYSWYIAPRNASGVATTCATTNKSIFTTAAAGAQPTASNGGSNVSITLPVSSVTLDGSASTGNIVQYYWFQAQGPVSSVVANNFSAITTATGLTTAGTYIYVLQVRDNLGVLAYSTKTVIVNPSGTVPVVPSCVTNTSPTNGSTLTTQTTATLTWPASSGATSYDVYLQAGTGLPVTLVTNTAALTYSAAGLSAGTAYSWYIAPRNASGVATTCATANKTTFTTAAAGVQPTASNGGSDVTITLPVSSVTLDGSASTGNIVQYYWFQAKGPVSSVVANNFAKVTTASGLTTAGTYVYVLQVIDNLGAHLYSQKTVTVKAVGTRIADTTAIQAVTVTPLASINSAVTIVTAAISPNPVPAGQFAKLQITSNNAGTVVINTVSSTGAVVGAKKVNLVAGINSVMVNTYGLGRGFHVISIRGSAKPLNLKLMLQ